MANYQGISAIKQVNRKKSEGKSSKYFGVSYHKAKKKWRAQMRQKGKLIHLGECTEEIDAATLYILAASKYYGQPVRQKEALAIVKD